MFMILCVGTLVGHSALLLATFFFEKNVHVLAILIAMKVSKTFSA